MRRLILSFALVMLLMPARQPMATPSPRRANIPYFASQVAWEQSGILWFGVNDSYQLIPGRNYADVRMAYTADALTVSVLVVDYYLWFNTNPQPNSDLTQHDAVALYLDTNLDRASSPKTDDYYFLEGLHTYPTENAPAYRRQAQGTGTGWNAAWNGSWTDQVGWQWSDTGPNNNAGNIDFGWAATFTIPWTTLGRSGPPPEGTLWGMGVVLYDRDNNPPAGYVAPEYWPGTFVANNPGTWGELHFGNARYQSPHAVPGGTTVIRAATPLDNTVEDAWMGGGGWCSGGHEGGSEVNHGNDQDLFVGSEIQPTHFPCYNKSYLRFALNSLPAGKVIISATLTLHHWGGANVAAGTSSYVWLSSVTDPWDEMTIHWNNAPLAQENLSMTRIPPKTTPLIWPGDPYAWDATQAVAAAYAAGQPVSFALYDSTTGRDSSKYLTASETGINDDPSYWNWNIEGRPKLTIVWGSPVAVVSKDVKPTIAAMGQQVTYTIALLGSGQALTLTDDLPVQVSAPGPVQVSGGSAASYDTSKRRLTWLGSPAAGQPVTITFPVTVQVSGPLAVVNTAVLTDTNVNVFYVAATFIANAHQVWLPVVRR